jgi:hypothetical protein
MGQYKASIHSNLRKMLCELLKGVNETNTACEANILEIYLFK